MTDTGRSLLMILTGLVYNDVVDGILMHCYVKTTELVVSLSYPEIPLSACSEHFLYYECKK